MWFCLQNAAELIQEEANMKIYTKKLITATFKDKITTADLINTTILHTQMVIPIETDTHTPSHGDTHVFIYNCCCMSHLKMECQFAFLSAQSWYYIQHFLQESY